jgi:type III restriction enzyme
MKDLKLVSGYDALYLKVKAFVRDYLFEIPIDLEDPNTLRNLSELQATKTVIEGFKKAINALTVQDKGNAEIRDWIKLRETRPFAPQEQAFLLPKKSVFNRIVGDSGFELEFAAWLDGADDVQSFSKNYFAVNFRLDYVKADGSISNYHPDFIVKLTSGLIVIVETKGQEDVDVEPKLLRLKQWCEDVNRLQGEQTFDFVYVDQESFEQYSPKTVGALLDSFRRYK